MSITTVSLSSIAPYEGPHEIPGIRFRPARGALGVTAWGMNVIELDPRTEDYPEHDHLKDGQEEVYVVLTGEVTIRTPDGARVLRAGDFCRVPPEVRRKLVTEASGATVLALGGTPGKAFTPTM